MTRLGKAALIAAAIPMTLLVAADVPAAPNGTRIEAVFEAATCKSATCETPRDRALASGAATRGSVQVHVRSAASVVGLDWVRLEARFTDDPRWTCIEQWDSAGETSFARVINWNTPRWHFPDGWGCPETTRHYHGDPTKNSLFTLRVKARERVSGDEEISSEFNLRFANAPAKPSWATSPKVSIGSSGRPRVSIEWKPNVEPDVIEYHFARSGPGGAREFVVDATQPERNGCQKVGSKTKTLSVLCQDDQFPAGSFSGVFRYAVFAYRPAPSGKQCSLKPQQCIESAASAVRSVSVSSSAAPASPPGVGPAASGRPTAVATTQPSAPLAIAPEDRSDQLAPESKRRLPALPIVGGFLLAAASATAVTRLVRLRRRDS